jgi:hypothetical protein
MAGSQYTASPKSYEEKLTRIMERFGVKKDQFTYNWDRFSSWIQFRYKGELYRFDQSIDNALKHDIKLKDGKDCFAQLVLGLEDLARLAKRGIYDLQRWVAGMKFLPAADELPTCFKILGFREMPTDPTEIDAKYKELAKVHHPDKGGNADDFNKIKEAAEKAKEHLLTINKKG